MKLSQNIRLKEKIIPLNKDLYVLGTAVPSEEEHAESSQRGTIKKTKQHDTLIISDSSEKEMTSVSSKADKVSIAIGSILVIGALLYAFKLNASFHNPLVSLIIMLVPILVGAIFIYAGFKIYKENQMMQSVVTSKAQSLSMGLTEMKGEAEPLEEPLTSPLSNRSCVGYTCKLQIYLPEGGSVDNWQTAGEIKELPLFYLKDETGKVPVDPKKADLQIPTSKQLKVEVELGHYKDLKKAIEEGKIAEAIEEVKSLEKGNE